ncbi:MAG: aminoacetone oxidase family FAD-binding enzyme, partial [Eubacterium sp.]
MGKIAIIGGGPAGMTAGIAALEKGDAVDLYDQNEKLGKKLYITGKGRCNVTNHCLIEDYFDNIVTNKNFLYSALYTFTNDQLMALMEEGGCPLKIERGERVFPESDKSSDIIKAYRKLLTRKGADIILNTKIKALKVEDESVKGIILEDGHEKYYDKVILATGGKTYISTGSDGSGFKLAQSVGHTITPLRPSLVGVNTQEDWVTELQGLSLRNVELTLKKGKKKIKSMMGEMLFTHFGVSGPLVLTMSAFMTAPYTDYTLNIDLKPGLSKEQLEARIKRDFEKYNNKNFINSLVDLLPSKMIPVMVKYSGISSDKKVNQITKAERIKLMICFKNMEMHVVSLQDMNTAIVTSGGVDVKEIDPSTMASKKVKGLFFAGEMIDVDALTGGF